MTYLFAAYSIIFLMIASYLFVLGKRQKAIAKQLQFLQDLDK
jgi:CcmD family protein